MVREIPYKLKIQGCVITLGTENSKSAIIKRLLVNPAWIDLWNIVSEGDFDLSLWNRLSNKEKNFMIFIANKMKIHNNKLHSANNNEAGDAIQKLKLIEGSLLAGNINKELIDEGTMIIDDLINRCMLYPRTGNNLKKRLQIAYNNSKNTVDEIKLLRKRI